MRASYWTQIGAMALPLGVSLIALATAFSNWREGLVTAGFVLIVIGFFSFIAGWVYMVRDEKRATKKEEEEQARRKNEDLQNKQEHDEIIAMLTSTLTRRKMSSPRILRFIEKLREIEGKEDSDDM